MQTTQNQSPYGPTLELNNGCRDPAYYENRRSVVLSVNILKHQTSKLATLGGSESSSTAPSSILYYEHSWALPVSSATEGIDSGPPERATTYEELRIMQNNFAGRNVTALISGKISAEG